MAAGHKLIRTFAGVNLRARATEIKDSELVHAENIWQPEPGILARIPQPRLIGGLNYYAESSEMMQFQDETGARRLVIYDPSVATVTELNPETGGQIQNIYTVGKTDYEAFVTWFAWNRKLYVFVTGQAPFAISGASGPLTVEYPFAAWHGALGTPSVACPFDGALFVSGFPAPYESYVLMTPPVEESWGTLMEGGYGFPVGGGSGDPIIAMREFPIHGGAQYAEPYMLVFKRSSVWMIQGHAPVSGTPPENVDLQVIPVNEDEGLVSERTLAWTEFGLVWCSGKNVWLCPYGGQPKRIGNNIAPMLAKAAQGRNLWSAVYTNGHYRLSVPGSTHRQKSDVGGGPVGSGTHMEWWCDLRDYDNDGNHQWWGPQLVSSRVSINFKLQTGGEQAISLIPGQTLGSLWVLDAEAPPYTNNAQATAGGEIEIRFKEFDFGDPMIEKIIEGIEVNYWRDSYGTIQFDMYANGFAKTKSPLPIILNPAGFKLAGGVPPQAGSVLDGTDVLAKEFVSTVAYPPDGERFIARTWQPVLKTRGTAGEVGFPDNPAPNIEIRAVGLRVRPIGRRPTP